MYGRPVPSIVDIFPPNQLSAYGGFEGETSGDPDGSGSGYGTFLNQLPFISPYEGCYGLAYTFGSGHGN